KRKTLLCEKCGFKAEHPCQLDVDHIDGKHNNNDESNLQVLCANCHRLKTFVNRDWTGKGKR
ncbi:MAG: HNH endonuclease signature motif containing protein, partial [Bacillus sp. (in: firmicutes)]